VAALVVAEPDVSTVAPAGVCSGDEARRGVKSSTVVPVAPVVRVSLPASCTVADLRAALRRMNGADRITDVVLTNEHGAVWLDPMSSFTLTVQPERTTGRARPGM
jgi:hypothetical protein